MINVRLPINHFPCKKRKMDGCNEEVVALNANRTWVSSDLPTGKTLVDCKWIYKIKYHSDRTLERHKLRLVARVFMQIEGLDFHSQNIRFTCV